MKNRIFHFFSTLATCALLLVGGSSAARAQVTVDAKIDSLTILLGEQTRISLDVSMEAQSNFRLPIFDNNILVPGVEVISSSKIDTLSLNDGKRWQIKQEYIITSFDTTVYHIPGLEVEVNEVKYSSNNLALRVVMFEVDTLNVNQFFGPKAIMVPPFSWDDWSTIFWVSVCLLLLSLLIFYLVIRYRDNKPIIKIIKVAPKIPPHQKAIKEIEEIKHQKNWTQEDSKEYYTKLTDTLRTYIQERYNFNAMEMTSGEIIERLAALQDMHTMKELRELLNTADLVKFAKHSTLINENDMNLMNAVEFINQTKVEVDPNAKPEPQEIKVDVKRSQGTRRILGIGILVLATVAVGMVVYIVRSIITLSF